MNTPEQAADYIAWAMSEGWNPARVFVAVGLPVPDEPSWGNALDAVIKEHELLHAVGPSFSEIKAAREYLAGRVA